MPIVVDLVATIGTNPILFLIVKTGKGGIGGCGLGGKMRLVRSPELEAWVVTAWIEDNWAIHRSTVRVR